MHEMGRCRSDKCVLGERGRYVEMVAREKDGGRAAAERTEREF
jgi:hypothetical protein